MTAERWQKIKDLFESAKSLAPDQREDFLSEACKTDIELKSEVEALIESSSLANTFLEGPVSREAPTMLEETASPSHAKTTGPIDSGKFIAGTILGDRYRIIGLLGKGGMGEVYKAEDLKIHQMVALKFLPEKLENHPDALNRFISEVRNARQISHPNVCRVFDIGEIEGKHYLSMEFIEGDDLSQLLNRIGRLPSDKANEISRQICFGLHAIHDSDLIHRDLKPANVIVDSKGKAKITDFGIAAVEDEIEAQEIRIGTPAYMSPEQLSGKEVTPRSDIYSLGLLLYEIYTGKQAFEAESVQEFAKKHTETEPQSPSEFVASIDPLVEKTIRRCLEKSPDQRPNSVLAIALALPGGNPLEAAIAAGETPSPEMVAAAPKKGALPTKKGAALLIGAILFFGFFLFAQHNSKIFNFSPPTKPVEVLAERSRNTIAKLGYSNPKAYSVFGFRENKSHFSDAYQQTVGGRSTNSTLRTDISKGRTRFLEFHFRQSPLPISPSGSTNFKESDPSFDVPGMLNLKLDHEGRLVELVAIPTPTAKRLKKTVGWETVFEEAGLDFARFELLESEFSPPVFADETYSWTGSNADSPGAELRIAAASLDGKPVYFKIFAPWSNKNLADPPTENVFKRAGVLILIGINILIVIGSLLLVRHNLRVGRADIDGARKLVSVIFVFNFLSKVISADHSMSLWGEITVLYHATADSIMTAFFIGIVYVALEPFVRRHWSELLISWNRLLSGDFVDPLIGRDILAGFSLGMGHAFGIFFGSFIFSVVTGNEGVISGVYNSFTANELNGVISFFLAAPVNAISSGFVALFILLGFFLITTKKNLSIFLVFLVSFTIQGLMFVLTQHWAYVFSALINSLVISIVIGRFGLVACVAFWLGFYFTYLSPLTLHANSIFVPNTLATIVVTISLLTYAFYISTARKPVLAKTSVRFADD